MAKAMYYSNGWVTLDASDAATLGGYASADYQKATSAASGTIPTSGWVSNTGDYPYKLDLAISGVTATDVVLIFLDKEVADTGQDAGLCPTNESYAGGVTLFAKSVPAVAMDFSCKIIR